MIKAIRSAAVWRPVILRKLWAVVIIETLKREDDFTFEVALRTLFKTEENTINVWV